jgi:hypothetical protein
MPVHIRDLVAFTAFAAAAAINATAANAQKRCDPGASDTEIKIGNIMPYSGPASAYGVIGKVEAAYFNKINAEGGTTAARSTSSAMTMVSVHRKRLNRHASWWKATRCCSSSSRSAPNPIRRSRNT